jgi:hypothetical protein
MTFGGRSTAFKGLLAAGFLFVLGVVTGVGADRIWLGQRGASAGPGPLTPAALARALDLNPGEADRVESVLDSLQVQVADAFQQGPDSLRSVALRARARLEQALPPDRRGPFQDWMQEHHNRMMREMGGGMMRGRGGPGGMMRGMMQGPDTGQAGY